MQMLNNSRVKFTAGFLVFMLSLIVSPFYTEGDQKAYRAVYDELANLELIEGFIFYTSKVSSQELVHFFLVWILSPVINKDIFIAFSNAILAYISMSLLQKLKAPVFISLVLLLTNYYIYVLYFAAERLKFGFIFLFLSMLYVDKHKRFYGIAFLAIISHVQIIIAYASIVLNIVSKEITELIRRGRLPKSLFFIILLLFILPFFIGDQFLIKFEAYYRSRDFHELVRIFIFFFLSLFYSKKKSQVFIIFFPLIILVLLVGGDRVNLYGYFVFLYYALQINREWNIGLIGTSIYYAYSTIVFLYKIFVYGDGYV